MTLEKRSTAVANKAADPLQSADGKAALRKSEDCRLEAAARLRRLEGHCRAHLERVLEKELLDRFDSDYRRVSLVHQQVSERVAQLPNLVREIVGILTSAKDADELASDLHRSAPPNVSKRLASFRDEHRDLFDRSTLFLDNQQLWPLRQQLDVARIAPVPAYDRRYSADWRKDADAKRQADEARQAEELVKNERERKSFYSQHP